MKYMIFLLAFFLVQCTNDNSSTESDFNSYDLVVDEEIEMDIPRTSKSSPSSFADTYTKKDTKIVRRGNIEMEVKDVKKAKMNIDILLKRLDGYYDNENLIKYEYSTQYKLKIRIPNNKFDTLINKLESGKGVITLKNVSVKDVTEEFIDINIRLKNKLAYLEQYKQLLKKAKSIKEILEVQEIIRGLESEIESKKGRLRYLQDKVSYSTLNLTLTEYKTISKTGNNFIDKIIKGFKNGFDLFLDFIIVLINIWPIIFLIIVIWFMRKRIFRRLIGRKK